MSRVVKVDNRHSSLHLAVQVFWGVRSETVLSIKVRFASIRFDHRIVLYVSFGAFPGLFDNIHGLLSQKSSLMMSKCCTTTRALALLFLSFSV